VPCKVLWFFFKSKRTREVISIQFTMYKVICAAFFFRIEDVEVIKLKLGGNTSLLFSFPFFARCFSVL